MATGFEIELVTVPWANDVSLFAKSQAGAFLVGGDELLDLIENLALAHRAAGMRADVLVGNHFVPLAKDANFYGIEGINPVLAVRQFAQFGNREFVVFTHVLCRHKF
jgi:hypothetical protein